jgi:hypothetical protein
VNTVLTGEAKFSFLHDQSAEDIRVGLHRAVKTIDQCLNMIAGRLGLDHDDVLFGRYAIPVMVRFMDSRGCQLTTIQRDQLLFWFAQAGMWGRFSGSTETFIDKDLAVIEGEGDALSRLLEELRLWHGGLRAEAGHFVGWSLGARFYPILYMLTRMGESQDLGNGVPLKSNLLGKMNRLEVHHIFPKAQLYKMGFKKSQVNAIANFCFLTKDTNLHIRDREPEIYFAEVEERHPGALASQWIPLDKRLWKLENYLSFLEERRRLLAEETNRRMAELLHDDLKWIDHVAPVPTDSRVAVYGSTSTLEEQEELDRVNAWVSEQGLARGTIRYEHSDPQTGAQLAVLDLAWPQGMQEGLSQPVAFLLDEEDETLAFASSLGFRCFTDTESFKTYVQTEVVSSVDSGVVNTVSKPETLPV